MRTRKVWNRSIHAKNYQQKKKNEILCLFSGWHTYYGFRDEKKTTESRSTLIYHVDDDKTKHVSSRKKLQACTWTHMGLCHCVELSHGSASLVMLFLTWKIKCIKKLFIFILGNIIYRCLTMICRRGRASNKTRLDFLIFISQGEHALFILFSRRRASRQMTGRIHSPQASGSFQRKKYSGHIICKLGFASHWKWFFSFLRSRLHLELLLLVAPYRLHCQIAQRHI